MLGKLIRRALRRGVVEGSRPWMAVGIAAVTVAVIRKVVSREPEPVYATRLEPGESLVVRVLEPAD